SAARIRRRVAELAREIDADYRRRAPVLVVVLKGAAIFAADLMRRLTVPVRVEFVTAASYGAEARSSGRVDLTPPKTLDLAGHDVLVVEDIIDSGLTCRTLLADLRRREPARLACARCCTKRSGGVRSISATPGSISRTNSSSVTGWITPSATATCRISGC